jgi:hypothetical protein
MIASSWMILNQKDCVIFDKQAAIIAADYAVKLAEWKQSKECNQCDKGSSSSEDFSFDWIKQSFIPINAILKIANEYEKPLYRTK